ncbi:extracellular solute-binding protein [Propioniciclava soli]|uniref:extracellular solute-binding protein n=1 Tax=Propioniciclava soli TaxID=2775081 RepID=UPI001E39CDE8|nr:extracellular solute-binding protein [Propioniciclava soli]
MELTWRVLHGPPGEWHCARWSWGAPSEQHGATWSWGAPGEQYGARWSWGAPGELHGAKWGCGVLSHDREEQRGQGGVHNNRDATATAGRRQHQQYYQSFFTEGLANTAPTSGTTEADFVSGAVPMFISGPWMMSSVENLGGEGFADQYAVAEMPTKVTNASFIGGSNLAVFSASENRDAAWKLVDYLTQEETQIEWFDMTSDLPSVQSAWDDAALQSDEKLATFGAQLETAYAPPAIQTWEQVANAFDAEVERVTITGSDAAAGLSALQQEATSIGMG